MQLPNNDLHSQVRRRLLAYMETGQDDEARTLLAEYAEEFPDKAKQYRRDIELAYGKSL